MKIYLDATSSMKGFADPKAGGEFIGFLQKMEQIVSFGWHSSVIQCYKFGARVTPLPGPQCYLQPTHSQFYDLSGRDDITQIDRAIEQAASPGSLGVIVTDLYQNDADLGSLFQAFKKHVFPKNFAVGIAAMRSRFSGTIYDIGFQRASREWRNVRPFYAIVVGGEADVTRYFQELARSPAVVPQDRLLILSPDLLDAQIEWKNSSRAEPSGVAEDPNLMRVASTTFTYGIVRLQEQDKSCALKLKIERIPLSFHPLIDWTKVPPPGTRVALYLVNADGTVVPAPSQDALMVSLEPPNAKLLVPTLQLRWNPGRLLRKRVYVADIRVVLDSSSVRLPGFVKDWSIPVSASLNPFDGSKTQNLEEFVSGLWRSMFEFHRPELGAYYIYFKK